ncbi:hypothetical protein D3C76_1648310 [compost metagenome]
MPLLIPVQAEQDQIRFRQVQRKGSIGDHIDNQKAHPLGFDDQIPQAFVPIPPQKGFPAAKK